MQFYVYSTHKEIVQHQTSIKKKIQDSIIIRQRDQTHWNIFVKSLAEGATLHAAWEMN